MHNLNTITIMEMLSLFTGSSQADIPMKDRKNPEMTVSTICLEIDPLEFVSISI